MNNLVDVHSHLDCKDFADDLPEVIERARKSGVCAIINNGLDHDSNVKTLEISERHDLVRAAFGLHPTNVSRIPDKEIESVIRFIEQHAGVCTAIGEIGLDYKYAADTKGKEKQKTFFLRMLDTAERLGKPVIVHSRLAESDVIELLEKQRIKRAVMHAFGGGPDLAKRIVKNRWYVSIPPRIVRSAHFQEMVRNIPISHILTETDCPYLGTGSRRNEPMFVAEAVREIARIKEMTAEDVADSVYTNFQRVFLD